MAGGGEYCHDVVLKYHASEGTNAYCADGAPSCCVDPGDCAGSGIAWHFDNGGTNWMTGPRRSFAADVDCRWWDDVYVGDGTQLTVCEQR